MLFINKCYGTTRWYSKWNQPYLTQFLLSFKNILDVIQTHSDQIEIVLINLKIIIIIKKTVAVWKTDTDGCGLEVEDKKRDRKTDLGWLINRKRVHLEAGKYWENLQTVGRNKAKILCRSENETCKLFGYVKKR